MSREFFSLNEATRGYQGGSQETPNSRIDPFKQPNSNAVSSKATRGGASTPLPVSQQSDVVCVMEFTHLTSHCCGQGVGGETA